MFKFKKNIHLLVVLLLVFLPLSGGESPIKFVFYLLWMMLALTSILFVSANTQKNEIASILIMFSLLVLTLLSVIKGYMFTNTHILETISVLFTIPIIYLISRVYDSSTYRNRLAVFILILSCLHGLAGLEQLINGKDIIWGNPPPGGRPSGIFSWGAPVVGSFCGVGLTFYYLLPRTLRRSWSYISVYIFLLLIILISGNRSILIIHLILFTLNWVINSKYPISRVLLMLLVAFIVLPFLFQILIDLLYGVGFLSENQIYRFTSLGGEIIKEQQTKRLATWQQTLCMVEVSPFIGYPIGSYSHYLLEFLQCAPISEGAMPHPHSLILEILVIFGFIGGSILLVIVWLLLLRANRRNYRENFSLFAGIGFVSPLNMTHGIVSFWWLVLMSILIGVAIANSR